ncbi:MAG: MBL fold metallo-hydrolase [Caldimicrobium sp.]|jgi:ribonuclease BN (tRNA processing enzyme)
MFEIIFLGTAGARYVVAKQLRASAGLLFNFNGKYLLFDPGPGTLVHLAKRKIYPEKVTTIVVSHKHLDHSADLNILVDAITEGAFKKKGRVFLTEESLKEGLLLEYLKNALEELVILRPKEIFKGEFFTFQTTCLLKHTAENYGFVFEIGNQKLGIITDTAFFPEIIEEYRKSDFLIVNLVRYEPREGVLHLSVPDVKILLKELKPKLTIITHFGMTMLKANPFRVAQELSSEIGLKVVAAYDGMRITL